jgi:hypothetical protein
MANLVINEVDMRNKQVPHEININSLYCEFVVMTLRRLCSTKKCISIDDF